MFSFGSKSEVEFLVKLRKFAGCAEEGGWAVGDVLSLLRTVRPEDEDAKNFLDHVGRTIGQRHRLLY